MKQKISMLKIRDGLEQQHMKAWLSLFLLHRMLWDSLKTGHCYSERYMAMTNSLKKYYLHKQLWENERVT